MWPLWPLHGGPVRALGVAVVAGAADVAGVAGVGGAPRAPCSMVKAYGLAGAPQDRALGRHGPKGPLTLPRLFGLGLSGLEWV